MNVQDYLLTTLIEECSEVIQAISKGQRFGMDNRYGNHDTKREHIAYEIDDLLGVIALCQDKGILQDSNSDRRQAKAVKVMHYLNESIEAGIVKTT